MVKASKPTASRRSVAKSLRAIASQPVFVKGYVYFSLLVLFATTIVWALLGARLQQHNADQLVGPYLFQHVSVLKGASFPAAHSFLFKWPLFWLVKLFGYSNTAYLSLTVLVVLATVGGLVAVIHRIERRPLVFGTLCLALATVLLAVPAQPYAGGLLPVNMAMLTTRNLEYILYIMALVLFVQARRFRSWRFWLGVVTLGLLMASDKLFLSLSIGGALLALVVYALANNWKLVSLAVRWLVGSLISAALGMAGLAIINASHLAHIAGQASDSPYGLVKGTHQIVLSVFYGAMGLLTNFGANPAYDATVVRHVPHQFLARLLSLDGPVFVINLVILIFGIVAVWRLVRPTIRAKNGRLSSRFDDSIQLSSMLVWSSLAAGGLFVITDHYYAVDARYLTITVFTAFIAIASVVRRRAWPAEKVVLAGLICLVGVSFGGVAAGRFYQSDDSALSGINGRNNTVVQVLNNHKVQYLVGDYWRTVPIRQVSNNHLSIVPLSDCTEVRSILGSTVWQPNLQKHSFAYLLTLDGSLTDYPKCSIQQVVAAYGRPNASTLIAGSLSKPQELLLFYDRGAHKSAPQQPQSPQGSATTVLPISPAQLPYTTCNVPTVMNIVAHQDDDLLFMNPDILHDVKSGYCIRTVYVTAGDAGDGNFYWLSREHGSEAAYAYMSGTNDIWVERIVQLAGQEFVTIANPRGNSNISLVFMHLPDGDVYGQGFSSSGFQSLTKLETGKINLINAVDGQSSYSSAQLVDALAELMHVYQPSVINTQANYASTKYTDHSDHLAVGSYVKKAYQEYEQQQYDDQVTIPLKFYIGYPIHQFPINLSDGDLQAKEAVFLAYAQYDGGVCHTVQQCQQNPAYGAYLPREYQNSN